MSSIDPAGRGIAAGEPTWRQIQADFVCPDWYTEARLGIWFHWGAQAQPAHGGGWYGRHMYMPDVGAQTWGAAAYRYHCDTYGHPSQAGFKDVLHAWKAENLDTDALIEYVVGLGARYVVAMANHHDHVDNFDSTHHAWNSVRVGPRRDIVGEFAASSRRVGLPFGVSSHDDRMVMFYEHAFSSDADGPYAGVPYDGRLTAADGVGTWWEGLDPADLYGPPPEDQSPQWFDKMRENWLLRHTELVEKYDPDLLWFDGYGFPYGDYGKELCRRFYARRIARDHTSSGVVVGKVDGDAAVVEDVERGVPHSPRDHAWQSTATFTQWFYQEDEAPNHDARTLIEMFSDVASKGGNLLLNIELRGDGTIPTAQRAELDRFGQWVREHENAIFGTRPWVVHGDNVTEGEAATADVADLEAAADHGGEHFNERTISSPAYPNDEVRFTTRSGHLYVFVMNPARGTILLPAVTPGTLGGVVESVRVIGGSDVSYRLDEGGLSLELDPTATEFVAVIDLCFAEFARGVD